MVTVIDVLVAPVLHDNGLVVPVAVKTLLPQLSDTVTMGVEGMALGEAVPVAALLVQPVTVLFCVTV